MKVIVIGAGWAGVAAAYEAKTKGAEVTLLERTDMILGTGLVGGIIRNNGRYTAFEELKALGIKELIELIDNNCLHKNIDFPGHKHASFYDVTKMEIIIREFLIKKEINLILKTRINKVERENNCITKVISDKNIIYEGDVFIDTTGSAGPMNNCHKYGNGCAMCILRCPSFQGRVSISELCNLKEIKGQKSNGTYGSMSGSCKILKETLSDELNLGLTEKGFISIPLEKDFILDHLELKACQQYALEDYKNNLIILDTGEAKLMTPYYPLSKLRKIKGLENARYLDPYAGGEGNSIRFLAISYYNNNLTVQNINNLLCAGEKTGLVGHTEAIITGTLAGYNAVKLFKQETLLELPRELCCGETIAFTNEQIKTKVGITKKYTISGSVLFERIKTLNLYTTNNSEINSLVEKLGLTNIFN